MTYRIEYLESVVREDIPKLSKAVRGRVRAAIERKLASHPIELGRPLRYSLKGARRLRVGDWRVIYKIEHPDVVLVVKIGHRREVYDTRRIRFVSRSVTSRSPVVRSTVIARAAIDIDPAGPPSSGPPPA